MYAWRARLGIMIPSSNVTMEQELYRMAPEGVSVHTGRMISIGCNADDLRKMDEALEPCAELVGHAEPDVLLFGCTSGSFLGGAGWEQKIRERIKAIVPNTVACTTTDAILNALNVYRPRKITIVNPYVDEVSQMETNYFRGAGYDVVSEHNMGFRLGRDIFSTIPGHTYRICRETVTKDTDLLFISCTNLRTIEIIESLEQDLGIPVITSNQASMWEMLCLAGVSTNKIEGFGELFKHALPKT